MYLGSVYDANGKLKTTKESRKNAKFATAILVDKTAEYTVEFWFKANWAVEKALQEENDNVTYLYRMTD